MSDLLGKGLQPQPFIFLLTVLLSFNKQSNGLLRSQEIWIGIHSLKLANMKTA